MGRLEGKRVIVTGGTTGIGAAVARRFVAEGAKVCVWGRNAENVAAITSQLAVSAFRADVAQPSQVDDAFGRSLDALGGLDVLICNAGVSVRCDFIDIGRRRLQALRRL